MNRERDVEDVLRSWIEEGVDLAPERFVWSSLEAIETTPQRGAWQASLEGFLMKFKSAAPYLGVAAVIVLAIAAYQVFGGPNIGNRGPSPSPTPTPRLLTSADLPNIALPTPMPRTASRSTPPSPARRPYAPHCVPAARRSTRPPSSTR